MNKNIKLATVAIIITIAFIAITNNGQTQPQTQPQAQGQQMLMNPRISADIDAFAAQYHMTVEQARQLVMSPKK